MEKLRKVEFDLQKFDEEGVPETSNKGAWFDYTETIKRRKGLFHEWGKSLFTKDDGTKIEITAGIVEEEGTGEVHAVIPERIKFLD